MLFEVNTKKNKEENYFIFRNLLKFNVDLVFRWGRGAGWTLPACLDDVEDDSSGRLLLPACNCCCVAAVAVVVVNCLAAPFGLFAWFLQQLFH